MKKAKIEKKAKVQGIQVVLSKNAGADMVNLKIIDNVEKDEFTLKDPGNSGNDVIDTLESYQRTNLSNSMKRIIENIENNEDNIKLYFKLNEEFNENDEEDTNKGYGLKTASIAISTPPNNTRFG